MIVDKYIEPGGQEMRELHDRRAVKKPKPIATDTEMEEISAGMSHGMEDPTLYMAGWADCWRYIKAKIRKQEDEKR